MPEVAIRSHVHVRGRFHRSVHLGRDWDDRGGLHSYLATPTVQKLALRIATSVPDTTGSRAWSLTGPFGSGKSAFAVFLIDILARRRPIHPEARAVRQAAKLRLPPLLPVPVVGRRSLLAPTLVSALADTLRPYQPDFAARVEECRSQDAESVWHLFQDGIEAAIASGFGGLLVIVDEFGKFLEHAALHPRDDDLFVLQHLAEGAARSPGQMLLVTIQHAAFADYLVSASQIQAAEWQKVQGRFTDEAFHLPAEQLLGLLASSLELNYPQELARAYEEWLDRVLRSEALDEARRRLPIEKLLPACVPFDPIASLLLWPLFRSKMAQNERSLFAFLTGHDPNGFQEFLQSASWSGGTPPLFRVAQLYDYVTTAIGSAALLGDRAQHWATAQHALDRLPADAPPDAAALTKAIALIGLYGAPVGLKASRSTLGLALGNDEAANRALDFLLEQSFVVYRRHQGDYVLWEGSDVDLDACFERALQRAGGSLAERLERIAPPRPWVARSHYIKTGTLRYFDVHIVDGISAHLEDALARIREQSRSDGVAIFVLAGPMVDREALIAIAQEFSCRVQDQRRPCLIAFPTPLAGIEEATLELEAWRWVSDHEPALARDPVARQEVRARLRAAQDHLGDLVGRVLGLSGHPFDSEASEWIHAGVRQPARTSRTFARWLSALCDDAFSDAPPLRNELLNRSQLSSAAAKARRNLLEAMIVNERLPRLGFAGSPPEATMYDAVLHASGLHRQRDGQWTFGPPSGDWRPVWDAIQDFLEATADAPQSVTTLTESLQAPPYGLRRGPIPVLLTAALLARRDEVALYENGVFVPELRIEHIERLLRKPEDFSLRFFRATKATRDVLAALTRATAATVVGEERPGEQLLSVVKPLVIFAAQLPPYARQTRRFDDPAVIGVRQTLLRATDPYSLVFYDLPAALGLDLQDLEAAETLARRLEKAIQAMESAYPGLLVEIETAVRDAFSLPLLGEGAAAQLRERAGVLADYAADRRLTTFIREAMRETTDWREGIGRVVADGIPPSHWKDSDVVTFRTRLRLLASDFVRLEELAAEHHQRGGETIVRIDVLNGRHEGARTLLSIPPEAEPMVETMLAHVGQALDKAKGISTPRRARIAVLALALTRELAASSEGGEA